MDKMNETADLDELNLDDYSFFSKMNYSFKDNQGNLAINLDQGITINIYKNSFDIVNIPQEFANLTFISLDNCEDNLRSFYNLDPNETLYIVSAETKNSISNRVTNQFIFSIYLDFLQASHRFKG